MPGRSRGGQRLPMPPTPICWKRKSERRGNSINRHAFILGSNISDPIYPKKKTESRTNEIICLAVLPSMKAMRMKGSPKLFEVVKKIKKFNHERKINLYVTEIGNSFSLLVFSFHFLEAKQAAKVPPVIVSSGSTGNIQQRTANFKGGST